MNPAIMGPSEGSRSVKKWFRSRRMALLAVPLAATTIATPFVSSPFRRHGSTPIVVQHASWMQDRLQSTNETFFGTATPAHPSDSDAMSVEVGLRFKARNAGKVTAIRFYKSTGNTGTHVGNLWDSSGHRLATVTFAGETASGWQQASLSSAVAIKSGGSYVVSYVAPKGHYASDEGSFDSARTTLSLTAYADKDGRNGVYKYGSGFPVSSFNGSNYYVDVSFTADPVTGHTPGSTAPPTTAAPTTAPPPTPAATTAPPTTAPPTTKPPATTPPKTTPPTTPAPTTTSKPPVTTAPPTTKPPTTTAPPTTTKPPSTGAFPNASNTGVPAGVALKASGSIVVSQAGTVIDGLDINGDVQINASNVTLKNSRVHSNGWVGIRIKDSVSGVVIQDVEVNGSGAAGTSNSNGIWGPATTYRANVYGYENPFVPGSGSVIQDSYVHDLGAPAGPHYDGVQIDGGVSNITIRHNTIINNNETVSAIMIDNYFGSIANITVDNNYLAGGGFTVYSDDSFNLNPISGVKFTNNRMGKGTWGYGYIGIAKPLDTGNVDATTGVTIRLG